MIQIKFTGDLENVFEAERLLSENFGETVQAALERIVADKWPVIEASLRKAPPQRHIERSEWLSEEQYRAAMAEMRKTQGVRDRYERTNNMVDAWEMRGPVATKSQFTITIRNPIYYSRYVQGSLAKTESFNRNQQPFHAVTGWTKAHEEITQFFDEVRSELESEIGQGLRKARVSARGSSSRRIRVNE